jgi:hypothetical protein
MAQGGSQSRNPQGGAQEAMVRVQEREAPFGKGQGDSQSQAEEAPATQRAGALAPLIGVSEDA